jgi:short-subunit dehydrogenase
MSTTKGGVGGCVISIGSIAAFYAQPYVPTYSSTKAGVVAMSRCFGVSLKT